MINKLKETINSFCLLFRRCLHRP